jgi:hypothetical protein
MAAILGDFSGFSINNSQGKIQRIFPLASARANTTSGNIAKFNVSAREISNNYFTITSKLQQPIPVLKSALNLDTISNTAGKTVDKTIVLALPATIDHLKALNFINKFKISASDSIAIYSSSTKVPIQFWS